MICAHCSTPVADEARFCHSCGSLVSDAEGQAAATAAMDQSSFRNMERLLQEDTKGVYEVKHMLGRGGMAVVYLATEIGLSRKVALKVLPPELTFGHGVERFKREARTAAALDHPHIIPIYRIGDSGKIFWYAMKFLEGKSLEDLLREQGSMSLEDTIDILEQVADALDYAHDHKVIHRDIKPANVMLDNRNRVIVTDFGIAKALSEGKLTATDSVIGTPYFMSPEQGMGKTVSGASDQYSVAVMAYRMLAGHVPFDGDSAIDILHKHCMFEAPSLHEDIPDIPMHVSNAIARALSKGGDDRFLTVHDFVQSMKDPEFRAKEPARPSGVTVVMNADDAKKLRTAGTNPAGANSGKNRTLQPRKELKPIADKTVVANAKPAAARPAPAPAPAPKSKAGLFAVIGLVLAAAGGVGYWQLTKAAPTTEPAPIATPAPITGPPANTSAAVPDTTPTVVAEVPETKAPETKVPESKAPVPATKAPTRPQPTATKTPAKSEPVVTAPAQTPAQTPTQTAPAPAPAAAVEMGRLQLVLTPPGTVEIDGKDYGEKSRFQLDLTRGTHVLRVRKDGYATITQPIEITPGTPTVLRLTLEPRP
jgi:serine/threonine protein kinase